jgi:hypothetical protein
METNRRKASCANKPCEAHDWTFRSASTRDPTEPVRRRRQRRGDENEDDDERVEAWGSLLRWAYEWGRDHAREFLVP